MVTEEFFLSVIFISLIGVITSFIILISLVNLERRIEVVEHERDRMRLEASLKESKFLHLSSQMKPHLIFNVLNTIISLLYFNKTQLAIDGMYSLSRMLRYTIDVKQVIQIKEECKYIEDYLSIEKIRFDEKLTYELDIEPSILDMDIPSLSLQTIVENACKHSLSTEEGNISIVIRGKVEESFVLLTISDNGIGTSNQIIKTFNHFKQNQYLDEETSASGIGLRNVFKRLRLHFGDQFDMCIINQGGTKVVLSIPLERSVGGNEGILYHSSSR